MAYAIQNISNLPFSQLIGGPLVAAIDAQAQAAKTTVDFILDVGFENATADITNSAEPSTDIGKLRYVTFKYTRRDPAGTPQEYSLEVPLLTIVPIPFIAINEVSIDFMAKISEAISSDRTKNSTLDKSVQSSAKGGWGPIGGSLKGSLSSKHSSTATSSSKYNTELTMNIVVKAGQDDMPGGMEEVLKILKNQITQVALPPPAPAPATTTTPSTP